MPNWLEGFIALSIIFAAVTGLAYLIFNPPKDSEDEGR